jgi:hypothetical protein
MASAGQLVDTGGENPSPAVLVVKEPKDDTGSAARSEDGFQLHAHARISDPKPPRNQNPKRDSNKALKRRSSQTRIWSNRLYAPRTRPARRRIQPGTGEQAADARRRPTPHGTAAQVDD